LETKGLPILGLFWALSGFSKLLGNRKKRGAFKNPIYLGKLLAKLVPRGNLPQGSGKGLLGLPSNKRIGTRRLD